METEAFREFRSDANAIADAAAQATKSASQGHEEHFGPWLVEAVGALTQAVLLVARELHFMRNH